MSIARALIAVCFAALSSGCVAPTGLPEGYTGPTAVISDWGFVEGKVTAHVFGVAEVDGTPVAESSTGGGAYGGLGISTRFTPAVDGLYVVKGELKNGASTLWIEDAVTGKLVTERVPAK